MKLFAIIPVFSETGIAGEIVDHMALVSLVNLLKHFSSLPIVHLPVLCRLSKDTMRVNRRTYKVPLLLSPYAELFIGYTIPHPGVIG